MTDLFNELKSGGEAVIDRWIAAKLGEDLHFDYKRKTNAQSPDLEQSDKKSLAATISAFANSEGGLLLWGVDACEVDGVDCLVGKCPITSIAAFKSNIEHAIADLISPPVPGLEIVEIPNTAGATSGYLAIMVPLSDRRLHIARHKGERAFYFRNGHKSEMMEVFQVRDQMLRRTTSMLLVGHMRGVKRRPCRDVGRAIPPDEMHRSLSELRRPHRKAPPAKLHHAAAVVDHEDDPAPGIRVDARKNT